MEPLPAVIHWPPLLTLYRLMIALALGLFIGLEREWRGKEAGLRTFGLSALMGGIGGLIGASFSLLCVALLAVLVVFLNIQSLMKEKSAELTTSVALLITGLTGVLCGMGHVITPTAVIVVSAGLLTWKEKMAGFSHNLSAEELRAAILLGILTFAIYPVLPTSSIDPWGLLSPRGVWMTVILVAAIGFINYIFWKSMGNRGMELMGFFGSLVNSSVVVIEIATRVKEAPEELLEIAYRAVIWATAAMVLRNGIILGLLGWKVLGGALLPFSLLLIGCAVFVNKRQTPIHKSAPGEVKPLPLKSPFSLTSALKFGLIFLALEVAGTLAQRTIGNGGFYAVSLIGGVISSASAVASAASLFTTNQISANTAANGAILASLASAAVNVAFVARYSKNRSLVIRLSRALGIIFILTLAGLIVQITFMGRIG